MIDQRIFPSPEPSADKALCPLIARCKENARHRSEFDQFTEQHKSRKIGDAGSLLQIVGYDYDGELALAECDSTL